MKTLLTDALRDTFDADYPNSQFRGLHVSIEFPEDRQHYPGVWVDYEPVGDLQVAGVGHREFDATGSGARAYTRWRFQGYATYTVAAMSSLERDSLYDEMVRVLAFGREMPQTREFRAYIEDNEFISCNFDFDEIGVRGFATSPGTPWGTDEFIYEGTLAMEVFGEFVSDNVTGTLIPISDIQVAHYTDQEADPAPEW